MNKLKILSLFSFTPFVLGCASTPERDFTAYDRCYGGFLNTEKGEEVVVCINRQATGIGRMGLHYPSFPIRGEPKNCVSYIRYELDSEKLQIDTRRVSCSGGLTVFTESISCILSEEKYECKFSDSEKEFELSLLPKRT